MIKIKNRLAYYADIKELSIDDLEFLRNVLDKDIEDILDFEPHQVIEMIQIVLGSNNDSDLENLYKMGKLLHERKTV